MPAAKAFSDADRQRFHNLLKLAAESPFAGERSNALAAAERLATKFGMTLDEAASTVAEPRQAAPVEESKHHPAAWAAFMMDVEIQADKRRRDEAMAAARARGLDAAERRAAEAAKKARPRTSRARLGRRRFARILLSETKLPFRDIAGITGLDVYQIVGLKLQMRKAEAQNV